MMENTFCYEMRGNTFTSRHHVINHIDTLLGLTESEKKLDSQDKTVVLFDRENREPFIVETSKLSTEEMTRLRNRILFESIYAKEWVQFILVNEETDEYVLSKDLKTDEHIDYLLDCAYSAWTEQEGSEDLFIDKTAAFVIMLNWEVPVVDRIVIEKVPEKVDMDSLPVAVNNRRILANTYSNEDSWKVFSERICKNDFVKTYLQKSQNNMCAVCKKELDDSAVIHHVDYDHKCAFCNSGLEWRIPRKRVQPNCELCFQEHKEWFEQCASKIRLVHSNCNYIIDHLV